jgi:hypothetical protein
MQPEETLAILEQGIEGLGIQPSTGTRTARSSRPGSGSIGLTETEGILHWDLGERTRVTRGKRSRRQTYRFEDLGPNQISQRLRDLDRWLTPGQGIREVKNGEVGDHASPVSSGRILLFLHGTFSNGENLVGAFGDTPSGREFLRWSAQQYDQLLAFNHPMLSVTPFLNALQLARGFADGRAEVDIVCHSRGGLVARWWLEALRRADGPDYRVVFVGSPPGGTALASPANIRGTLDLLANFSSRLARATSIGSAVLPIAAPIFQATAVIAGIVSCGCRCGCRSKGSDRRFS